MGECFYLRVVQMLTIPSLVHDLTAFSSGCGLNLPPGTIRRRWDCMKPAFEMLDFRNVVRRNPESSSDLNVGNTTRTQQSNLSDLIHGQSGIPMRSTGIFNQPNRILGVLTFRPQTEMVGINTRRNWFHGAPVTHDHAGRYWSTMNEPRRPMSANRLSAFSTFFTDESITVVVDAGSPQPACFRFVDLGQKPFQEVIGKPLRFKVCRGNFDLRNQVHFGYATSRAVTGRAGALLNFSTHDNSVN